MKRTVKIQRLSESTMIKDCGSDVMEFSGLTHEEIYGTDWRFCAKIADLDHEIWRARIGRKRWEYFNSIHSIISKYNL